MAELATLARPYANAIFEVARASGEPLGTWSRRLALLAAAIEEGSLRRRLMNPALGEAEQVALLADLVSDEINDTTRNFLRVLAQNDRLELLPEISERFEVLRAEAERVVDVEIVSAYELDDAERALFDTVLAARFAGGVNLRTRVDESLVGGAIVRAGDMVIDGTVQGRLAKLRETLLRV